MNWQEKIQEQKQVEENRRCNRTIHVNLNSRAQVYRWLKEQSAANEVTLSTLVGMILESAMEQNQRGPQ